jgi:hypothetical protein
VAERRRPPDYGELGWVDDGEEVGDGEGLVAVPVGDVLVAVLVGFGDVLVAVSVRDALVVGVRVGVAERVGETVCCTVPTCGELVSGGGGGRTCRYTMSVARKKTVSATVEVRNRPITTERWWDWRRPSRSAR